MKLTFPHLGNVYIPAKVLLDEFGHEYIIPPYNSKEALEIGTKYAPELACLPLKINIGNFIQAHRQGADTILITGGCGPCRFGYYCEMHREILKDIGYPMDVIALEIPDNNVIEFLRRIKRLANGFNLPRILKVTRWVTHIAKQVDELEAMSYRVRPREKVRGATDDVFRSFQKKAWEIKGAKAMLTLLDKTRNKLLEIPQDFEIKPLKIGIVGEIYTTIDPFTNFEIQTLLGKMGVETARAVTVSGWLIDHMLKKLFHLKRDLRYAEAARPYLGTMIGGHAQETIGHSVLYAQEGFDGVIQVYPFSCMPEIVAQSILPSVERDLDFPVLTLIIDEMTGQAGYLTRIEAFVDLLRKRREKAVSEKAWVLSRG